jgi:serine/threonine protein kinase
VVDFAGRGTHGAVYRAVQVDKEHATPVALKLALLPRNPRFAREAEVLARTRNPSVPRLWEAGEWQHPGGDSYPYLAMEWIDGVPLYAWARQHPPSSQEAMRLLAQLARALQAVHSHGSLHRDVKGDNVLVRRSDGRAMLIDFGSSLYPEASTLTPPDVQPGTPAYRSPESGLFELNSLRDRSARYRATPADDLYALGVTACRLLTGEYPQFPDPTQDEHGIWHMAAVETPASLLQVEPLLREWVLRLLSVQPEARGSAAQVAEQLERAVLPADSSPAPNPAPQQRPPALEPPAVHLGSATRWRTRWPGLALGVCALMLLLTVGWGLLREHGEPSSGAQVLVPTQEQPDAGTAGLGEAASSASTQETPEPTLEQAVTEDSLPEPLPGQIRPDDKGHCPHKQQVALNGGCWVLWESGKCESLGGSGQIYEGRCYVPALPLPRHRPPTSSPH